MSEEYNLKDSKVQVIINAEVIDENAKQQIFTMAKHPAFQGLISIMPDVHLGKGSVIGFTGKFKDCVIPNVVGVDIGCGVSCYKLGKIDIDFEKLDKDIKKKVPLGFCKQNGTGYSWDICAETWKNVKDVCEHAEKFYIESNDTKHIDPLLQIGTLGGGNHFIEISIDEEGNKYLLVHSGSRNFGKRVAEYYQNMAKDYMKKFNINVPADLEYLPMDMGGDKYIEFLDVAQCYAHHNRKVMIEVILKLLGKSFYESNFVESVHNFISPYDDIIRKGAIRAAKGEEVIIPFNMAEGSILGIGKGNSKYNNSAPHGSGRIHSRSEMKRLLHDNTITMDEFNKRMEGIYSSCINISTIDESPMAYKQFNDIKKHLEETVEIQHRLKPVYNLKAGGEE